MPQKPKGTAAAGLLWDIIPPLLMLSSLRRCLNAVHAYYSYRPSYTSGITSWDLLPQMTGRLAAREETSEPGRPAAVATRSRLEMFAAAFFPRGLARACVCVCVSLKWALLGRLPDWNICPQESHCPPQLLRLRPQLGTSARRSIIS